ncbi:MAG: hypothetical protein KA717_32765 [Woronichinia naegeliana WA131]|jgi:hypothetical protein|uniref:Transposase n=1 Tax=Woronichinia naegeliana WA131 TaxID=2824559 RepID=A0A977PVM4_9CYAN|nr:MAG: hypothetical protein KA717_32765 [Woronichinia naegeliana WA131]
MLKIFPSAEIRCLCGDREFIGQAWVRYLLLDPMLAFCSAIPNSNGIKRDRKTVTDREL